MTDIVDLRIEAENLASSELTEVVEDLTGLGQKAERTQEQVDKLEVSRRTVQSLREAANEIERLQQQVSEAEAEYRRLNKELKNAESATKEQAAAVSRQQQVFTRLRGDLRAAERDYRNTARQLQRAGVDTNNLATEQQRLSNEIKSTRNEAERLNNTYDEQVAKLRERITQERANVEATRQQAEAQARTRRQIEAQSAARREAVQQAVKEAQVNKELENTLRRYEAELERLNKEKADGVITTGQYIRGEEKLRRQLGLTANQASVSRRAIEADAKTKDAARRSTDALTTVTRRLAQAYTVLIAAQSALNATIGNVQAYGRFEQELVNIERTTGIAADRVRQLGENLDELGTQITPTAISELNKIAEIAGQLGVKGTADIENLVTTVDQLAVSTNIAAEEAATLSTRILETTGEGIPKIQNFASTLVDLGNNVAATESEIAQFTREVILGTRQLDLGAAAAAGFGATIVTAGLRAESSRTAISRLSTTIRRAVTEGGEGLEELANITQLTGEQIEEAFGERSQDIIVAFIEGLKRLEDEGAATIDVLKRFGIDGSEALQVFSVLSGNIDQLRENLARSESAWESANAQVIEAARAYATQEGAVGRLRNEFESLRIALGEAFSDETDINIRRLQDALNSTEEELIEVFEVLPDVIDGIDELLSSVNNLAGGLEVGLGDTLSGIVESFVIFGNTIAAGLNSLAAGFISFQLVAAETGTAVAEMFDVEIDTSRIENLRTRFNEISKSIARDSDDVTDALNRLSGTSSRSYEDLIDTVERYGSSISRLTSEQQKQLGLILNQNQFIADQQGIYRELTAALVKANRQREIEAGLTERNNQLAENSSGQISEQTGEIESNTDAKVKNTEVTDKVLSSNQAAIQSYIDLGSATSSTALQFANVTREQLELRDEINESVRSIQELERQLNQTGLTQQRLTELTSELQVEQRKLNELRQQEVRLNEIATSSFIELESRRNEAVRQLQVLEVNFRNGSIAAGEYQVRQQQLSATINELNSILGRNTELTENNTFARESNADAVDTQADSYTKLTRTTSLYAEAQAHLNREFDFSNKTTEELSARVRELEGFIQNNNRVTSSWWRELAKVNNEGFTREQQLIRETILVRDWIKAVESGTLSLSQIDNIARRANSVIRALGNEQLLPLRRAIDSAKRDLLQFNDAVEEALAESIDRLDRIRGNEQEIVRRQFERERQEIQDLIDQARSIGNVQAIRQLQRTLRNLEQAQRLEFEQQFGDQRQRTIRDTTAPPATAPVAPQQVQRYEVDITLPTGQRTTVNAASEVDANNLVSIFRQLSEVTG